MPYRNKASSSEDINPASELSIELVPLLLQPVSSDVKAYTLAHWSLPRRTTQGTGSLTAG